MRKGDGADGQRAKVMGNFITEDEGEESSSLLNMYLTQWWRNNLPVGGEVNEITMTHKLTLSYSSWNIMGCMHTYIDRCMHNYVHTTYV